MSDFQFYKKEDYNRLLQGEDIPPVNVEIDFETLKKAFLVALQEFSDSSYQDCDEERSSFADAMYDVFQGTQNPFDYIVFTPKSLQDARTLHREMQEYQKKLDGERVREEIQKGIEQIRTIESELAKLKNEFPTNNTIHDLIASKFITNVKVTNQYWAWASLHFEFAEEESTIFKKDLGSLINYLSAYKGGGRVVSRNLEALKNLDEKLNKGLKIE